MQHSYLDDASEIAASISKLREALPDAMQGFTLLAEAATTETSALDKKTKHLIALAMALLLRSESCMIFHLQNALAAGLTYEELLEVIKLAAYMGGGPVLVFTAQTLKAYEQLSQ